jgi:hypothetical protein
MAQTNGATFQCAGSVVGGSASGAGAGGVGNASLVGGGTGNVGYIQWHHPNGNRWGYMGWSTSTLNIHVESGGSLLVDGCSQLRVNINTSNTDAFVIGSTAAAYFTFKPEGAGTNNAQIGYWNNGWQTITFPGQTNFSGSIYVGNTVNLNGIGIYNNGGWVYSGNGFMFAGCQATSPNAQECGTPSYGWSYVCYYNLYPISHRAQKKDIEPLTERCWDIVKELAPKRFKWNFGRETHRPHLGFILDEVRDVVGNDFGAYHPDLDGRHEVISIQELTAVLWQACREMAGRIEQLERQVNDRLH